MAEKRQKKSAVSAAPKKSKKRKRREGEETPPIYVQIFDGGRRYETRGTVKTDMRKPWQKPNPQEIRAVISGVVLSLFVREGDSVEKDRQLMVFEAMKMHNVIRAPFAGVVEQILVAVGDKLSKGALMMVIRMDEREDAADAPIAQESCFDELE